MKKESKKRWITYVCASLALAMGMSVIAPSIGAYAAENKQVETTVNSQREAAKELDKLLKEDKITQAEWEGYVEQVKEDSLRDGPTPFWKGAVIKKAMKFAVKHANVIPSKKLREVVKKYGGKIIHAIDTIDAYTWYGIAKALTKAGIPDKYADMIADFLVTFIL